MGLAIRREWEVRMMDEKKLYPCGVESARVIQIIETRSSRGSGTPDQPARIVTEYWSLNGEKLAESDPIVTVIQEDVQ